MKKVMLFLFVAIFATGCNAQDNKKLSDDKANVEKDFDNKMPPKGSWKVSKEVDEYGNIIRYDSIYSWSSHSLKGMDTIDHDSIMKNMHSMMRKHFSMSASPNFDGFAAQDSIFKQFFSDDFFLNGIGPNRHLEEMMKRMEAMQQRFFSNEHRYVIPPEQKPNPKLKKTQI